MSKTSIDDVLSTSSENTDSKDSVKGVETTGAKPSESTKVAEVTTKKAATAKPEAKAETKPAVSSASKKSEESEKDNRPKKGTESKTIAELKASAVQLKSAIAFYRAPKSATAIGKVCGRLHLTGKEVGNYTEVIATVTSVGGVRGYVSSPDLRRNMLK